MRRFLTTLGLAIAAASLAACNIVVTEAPMFSEADASGAPVLKPGLWGMLDGPCEGDLSGPVEAWPECAEGVTITAKAMTGKNKKGEEESLDYILASGTPRVMQVGLAEPDSKVTLYFYTGVEPLASDGQGRITAFKGWIVQCGPPPPKDAKRADGQPRTVTLEPVEGMSIDPQETMCMPADKDTVRRAAAASKGYEADKGSKAVWVREKP